jgi:hypothetical protein
MRAENAVMGREYAPLPDTGRRECLLNSYHFLDFAVRLVLHGSAVHQ